MKAIKTIMMRNIFLSCTLLSVFVTVDTFAATASDEQVLTVQDATQIFEKGKKANKNNISVVDLYGTWHEMGRQYGMLMKQELGEVHQFLRDLIDNGIVPAELADAVVDKEERQTPYRVLQFMHGASETSGLTERQLQVTNALERISGLAQCSAAFCWGDYAAGSLVIGRNYDYNSMLKLLKNDVAVTVYHPSDGSLAVATIGYVGEIYSVNALNEKGIFLELNNGSPSVKMNPPGPRYTGTTMLFSGLFETDELADWELFFNTIACSSSYIINMADSQRALSYEWCPIGMKHGEGTLPEGLMVSTNYFLNPEWPFEQPSDEKCWKGITRRNNLINLCEAAKGNIDEQTMKQIIATPIEEGGAVHQLTVFQMVVTPETKTLLLRVIDGEGWLRVDLASFLHQGTTSIAQIRSTQPEELTIRPGRARQVCLNFRQAPKKAVNITIYSLSGTKLCQQTLSPTGATTYTVDFPQAQRGAHIVWVNSQESGHSASGIVNW